VAQKYIEKPLLIMKKKFDIRQWVLVTDFNPLTIWFYERSYCRFGVENFSMNNLKNRYIHLTNNSIVKKADKFYFSEINGCMWHTEELAEYLREKFGYDIWEEKVLPRIQKIIIHSLECVQERIENRKNSFELYGYDIMLDDQCNPWLIEVNSSPAMDYSTAVTEELVQEVLEDTVAVATDWHFASWRRKNSVDTGNWTLLYRSKNQLDRPFG
jgi:tubulin monoglycylase TTLL3/8